MNTIANTSSSPVSIILLCRPLTCSEGSPQGLMLKICGEETTMELEIPLTLRAARRSATKTAITNFWHNLTWTHCSLYDSLHGANYGTVLTTVALLEFFAHILPAGTGNELWAQFVGHIRGIVEVPDGHLGGHGGAAELLADVLGNWAREVIPGALQDALTSLGDPNADNNELPQLDTPPAAASDHDAVEIPDVEARYVLF
ncbi:hypothetical protein C8T65DRAFT_748007 [Cerioporus squamosus]|nr:hypothetical protein C8T65DRAFT_748007 [Cerioporus squamosus]